MIRKPRVPQAGTLRRYGLKPAEWLVIAERQGNVCAICKVLPENGRLCTDHEHVKGWKKMRPEERKKAVRGLLCWVCNHYFCGRGITQFKAKNVYRYLRDHARRLEETL